jgi:hypothetical protein
MILQLTIGTHAVQCSKRTVAPSLNPSTGGPNAVGRASDYNNFVIIGSLVHVYE